MIVDALAGRVPPGSSITLKGWVRTRRDSKAGLSFIHLHDGSCFGQLQIVAPKAPGLAHAFLALHRAYRQGALACRFQVYLPAEVHGERGDLGVVALPQIPAFDGENFPVRIPR